jgi:spore cortex biosynthesis protein YabQ
MVLSLATGGWLMMVYDILRLLRLAVRHHSFWVGAEDFLYWMYAGVVTFMLLYEQNDGTFRLYVIIGVFLGMLLYDKTMGRIGKFFFLSLKKLKKCIRMRRKGG